MYNFTFIRILIVLGSLLAVISCKDNKGSKKSSSSGTSSQTLTSTSQNIITNTGTSVLTYTGTTTSTLTSTTTSTGTGTSQILEIRATRSSEQITITFTFGVSPQDTIQRIDLRRKDGTTAPDCSTGEIVKTYTAPFSNTSYQDTVTSGTNYSYDVCVYDLTGALYYEKKIELSSGQNYFEMQAERKDQTVTINFTFHAGADAVLKKVDVRKLEGTVAPECTTGQIAKTYVPPYQASETYTDTWASGKLFSYRICGYDGSNNLIFNNALLLN